MAPRGRTQCAAEPAVQLCGASHSLAVSLDMCMLCRSICSRWLLLSNPGSKVARFFSAAPVAELGSQTLCAEMARASWSLQVCVTGIAWSLLTVSLQPSPALSPQLCRLRASSAQEQSSLPIS